MGQVFVFLSLDELFFGVAGIVMDDAQNATHGTLEELRLLLGLNLPSQPTFALILIGDEYLLGQLQLGNHRALCSRLGAHHLLSPWTWDEIQWQPHQQRGPSRARDRLCL